MIFSRDTSLEADRVMVDLMRKASIGRKWAMVDQQCELVRSLARSGLKLRYPDAEPAEIEARLYDLVLGPEFGPRVLAARRERESRGGEHLGPGSHCPPRSHANTATSVGQSSPDYSLARRLRTRSGAARPVIRYAE